MCVKNKIQPTYNTTTSALSTTPKTPDMQSLRVSLGNEFTQTRANLPGTYRQWYISGVVIPVRTARYVSGVAIGVVIPVRTARYVSGVVIGVVILVRTTRYVR